MNSRWSLLLTLLSTYALGLKGYSHFEEHLKNLNSGVTEGLFDDRDRSESADYDDESPPVYPKAKIPKEVDDSNSLDDLAVDVEHSSSASIKPNEGPLATTFLDSSSEEVTKKLLNKSTLKASLSSQMVPSKKPSTPLDSGVHRKTSLPSLTTTKSPLEYKPQRPSFAGNMSTGVPNQIVPSKGPLDLGVHNQSSSSTIIGVQNQSSVPPSSTTTKSPLEYKPQRPSFAGNMSTGVPNQIVPSKASLGLGAQNQTTAKPPITLPSQSSSVPPSSATKKSPLEYKPQRPSFAGNMSTGVPNQIIPSKVPLGLGAQNQTTTKPPISAKSQSSSKPVSNSSSKPQTPPNSNVSGGVPSKAPLHLGTQTESTAKPPSQSSLTTPMPVASKTPLTDINVPSKAPLDVVAQNQSTAKPPNQSSSASPMPANSLESLTPSTASTSVSQSTKSPLDISFEDQFEEVTKQPAGVSSPLEYKPQRPSFAGSMSSGVPNQIVPSKPPLDLGVQNQTPQPQNTLPTDDGVNQSTKSPLEILFEHLLLEEASKRPPSLEYQPQRPSFAGSMSSGVPNQIVPSKPQNQPTESPIHPHQTPNPLPTDGVFNQSTMSPLEIFFEHLLLEEASKRPPSLEYQPQRPSFAGSMSSGVPNQIVPSKPQNQPTESPIHPHQTPNPLPTDGVFNQSTMSPLEILFEHLLLEEASKRPPSLEYLPQRPSFAGSMSNGVPNQIVPSMPPGEGTTKQPSSNLEDKLGEISPAPGWLYYPPTPPPTKSPIGIPFEDLWEEVTKPPLPLSASPLAYKPLRPSYAGSMSNGVPSQIIPSGPLVPGASYGPSFPYEVLRDTTTLNVKRILESIKVLGPSQKAPTESNRGYLDLLRALILEAEARGPRGYKFRGYGERPNQISQEDQYRHALHQQRVAKKVQEILYGRQSPKVYLDTNGYRGYQVRKDVDTQGYKLGGTVYLKGYRKPNRIVYYRDKSDKDLDDLQELKKLSMLKRNYVV